MSRTLCAVVAALACLGQESVVHACDCDDFWRGRPLGWTRDARALAFEVATFNCGCVLHESVQLIDGTRASIDARAIGTSDNGFWQESFGGPKLTPRRLRARRKAALAWGRATAPIPAKARRVDGLAWFVKVHLGTGDLQCLSAIGVGVSRRRVLPLWGAGAFGCMDVPEFTPADAEFVRQDWVRAVACPSPDRRLVAILAKGKDKYSPTPPVMLASRDMAAAAWVAHQRAVRERDRTRAKSACMTVRYFDRRFYRTTARASCKRFLAERAAER